MADDTAVPGPVASTRLERADTSGGIIGALMDTVGDVAGWLVGMFGILGARTQPFITALAQDGWHDHPYNIPGPTDMVRMELREVFRFEERAQQLAELPSEDFYEYMLKHGYNQYWADSYWASHWELPSINMAFEMFQRLRPGRAPPGLEFTHEDLMQFLKRSDVLKQYREQLTLIAYAPYNRVDIRRMRRLGVLTKDDVLDAYKDLGYDEEHARNLAEFTERDILPDERGLTKSEMSQAYIEDIVPREELLAFLKDQHYPDRDIDVYMRLVDLKHGTGDTPKSERVLTKAEVIKAFNQGVLSRADTVAKLSELGYSSSAIGIILASEKGLKS